MEYIPKQLYFVKNKFMFCFYIWGFAAKHTVVPTPSSFTTEGSTVSIGIKEPISSAGSDTLRERLHF